MRATGTTDGQFDKGVSSWRSSNGCGARRERPSPDIGPLEADILVIVWDKERVSVRDVYETLRAQRKIAYTTVMTVMNNLAKKDLLKQDRTAIAYLYTPAVPGTVVAQAILDNVIEPSVRRPAQRRGLPPARSGRDAHPRAGRRAQALRRGASGELRRRRADR